MNLYKDLKKITQFQKSFSEDNFTTVPSDWFIIITDIIGSTAAIEAGKYKDVNIAGGLSVVALANAFHDMEFPFVFGGDGVTFVIPPEIQSDAADILIDTKREVKNIFGLNLRIGIVPVSDLIQSGKILQIGKMAVSEHYDQAILHGNAVDTAESWVKKVGSPYLVDKKTNESVRADFTGFTCRWQDVKSSEGETVALIIKVREDKITNSNRYYEDLVAKMMHIAGDESKHHPIKPDYLKMSGGKYLQNEAKAMAHKKSGLGFMKQLGNIYLENIISFLAMTFQFSWTAGYYKIKDIRYYNTISSDYRKYDGTLKMVLSLHEDTRKEIESFLKNEYDNKNIFYGIHISNRALLTCLLHTDSAREVHFVDAADGGYALAARQMKQQMREEA